MCVSVALYVFVRLFLSASVKVSLSFLILLSLFHLSSLKQGPSDRLTNHPSNMMLKILGIKFQSTSEILPRSAAAVPIQQQKDTVLSTQKKFLFFCYKHDWISLSLKLKEMKSIES